MHPSSKQPIPAPDASISSPHSSARRPHPGAVTQRHLGVGCDLPRWRSAGGDGAAVQNPGSNTWPRSPSCQRWDRQARWLPGECACRWPCPTAAGCCPVQVACMPAVTPPVYGPPPRPSQQRQGFLKCGFHAVFSRPWSSERDPDRRHWAPGPEVVVGQRFIPGHRHGAGIGSSFSASIHDSGMITVS